MIRRTLCRDSIRYPAKRLAHLSGGESKILFVAFFGRKESNGKKRLEIEMEFIFFQLKNYQIY